MLPRFPQHESRSVVSSRQLRPVTPNNESGDEEDSDESFTKLTLKARSESIPIDANKLKRTPSEVQLFEEEAIADYRDYAMFTRIVDGITKTQLQTRDCRWRHANDVSLQHVFKTRSGENHGSSNRWGLPDKLQSQGQATTLVGLVSQVYQDEEALFTLEL